MPGSITRALVSAAGVLAIACADGRVAREALVVEALVDADLTALRHRPALAHAKLAAMAADPIDFFRGGVPLWTRDWRSGARGVARSAYPLARPLVWGLGDPHPGNFGVLRASDGTLALEPNDLDGAERLPYLWDVRRLAVGVVLWAWAAELTDDEARAAAISAARGYADGVRAAADGHPPGAIVGGTDAILEELFEDAIDDWDAREELERLTVLAPDGTRRFLRGLPDTDAPEDGLADLAPVGRAALPAALARYQGTLLGPMPPGALDVLDAVRVFGRGVASRARVRVLVLVRGPTDDPEDDVILELKELVTSGAASPTEPPGVAADGEGPRVVAAARRAWARPDADPRWGWTSLLGLPAQVRDDARGNKGLTPGRLLDVDPAERADALTALAASLGTLVARAHAADDDDVVAALAAAVDDVEGFALEQGDVALELASGVELDRLALGDALATLGPGLGIVPAPPGEVGDDVAALIGTPPPLPEAWP